MEKSSARYTDYDFLKKIDPRFWAVMISASLWGLFAHGIVLFNKYSWHDDTQLFGIGGTFSLGRWFLEIIGIFVSKVFNSGHFSTPSINGIFSIFCVALISYILIRLFKIRRISFVVLITGLMVVFPSLTATFGYMFTAPYYMFAMLMAVYGAYLLASRPKWYTFGIGVILIGSSIGIYQAYIPVAITVMLFCFMVRLDEEDMSLKDFLIYGIYLIFACIVFMGFYAIMNKVCVELAGTFLGTYQGINEAGKEGMGVYLSRLKFAYKYYLVPGRLGQDGVWDNMYPWAVLSFYYLQMALSILLIAVKIYRLLKEKKVLKAVETLFLIAFIPLATNFIFIMTPLYSVYALTTYAEALQFVFFAYLADSFTFPKEKLGKIRPVRLVAVLELVLLLLTSVTYARYDGACYLKAEITQTRAISYFNDMIAAIKSTEGYKDEYPVAFINPNQIQDKTMREIGELNALNISPYFGTDGLLNNYVWGNFLNIWCAYKPDQADPGQFVDLPEVTSMPHYPDQGSIKVVNETVVVKF